MKNCPKSTPTQVHPVREVVLGPTCTYTHCDHCKEDVDYIARGMGLEWNDANDVWAARGPARPNGVLPDYEENEDLDGDDFEDDDGDDAGIGGVAQQPANWNPHPVRNMGQGNRHIVLHNDQRSAAHLVMEILRRVFQKDQQECHFIMSDAHYHGRAKVFECTDDAEAQRYIDQIDLAKQDIANSGTVGADTIDQLQFTVEVI